MRIALCRRHAGHRFMSMIDDAFQKLGHSTHWIELEEIKTENELISIIRKFAPDFLFSLTANPQLTEIIPEEYPIVHYELDKVMSESLLNDGTFKSRDIIFSTYKNDCIALKRAGAGTVEYLPFFFNAKESKNTKSSQYPVSFVGTLGLKSDFKWYLDELKKMVTGNAQAAELLERGVIPFCDQLLTAQDQAFENNKYALPQLVAQNLQGPIAEVFQTFNISPKRCVLLLSKESAFRQRFYYLNEIDGLHTWGGDDWKLIEWKDNKYEGPASLYEDTADIYKRSAINLNIQRIYAQDGLSDRVFNVMMTGGFLLADRNESITELFNEGEHVELFQTRAEMLDKIAYYRKNSTEREKIASAGQKEVLAKHSCFNRMEYITSKIPL